MSKSSSMLYSNDLNKTSLHGHAHRVSVSMFAVFSAILWLVFATAGIVGLIVRTPRVGVIDNKTAPMTVERLTVNIVKSISRNASRAETAPRPLTPQPQPAASLALPPLLPATDTRLEIPFPVTTAQRSIVSIPRNAAFLQTPQSDSKGTSSSVVERLTLGEGEGDQPAPEYPREAKLSHQQGNVIVQMTIGKNGDVTDAKITSACAWPILNQAALRAVRDTWHFAKGPIRYRDIEFVFELHQH